MSRNDPDNNKTEFIDALFEAFEKHLKSKHNPDFIIMNPEIEADLLWK
jgi:hypothetical protein